MSNTTTQAAVTITGSGKVCAVINGQSYTIANDHPKYKEVIEANLRICNLYNLFSRKFNETITKAKNRAVQKNQLISNTNDFDSGLTSAYPRV